MKKRSIVIVLAMALLLVPALAGSASAYDNKVPPSVIEADCYMNWPSDSSYDGFYSVHVEWSLTAGTPRYYQIERDPSFPGEATWFSPYYKITPEQLKAGALTTIQVYYEGHDSDGWRVKLITSKGKKSVFDYTQWWGA